VIRGLIPQLRQLQDSGQVEVAAGPYADAVLPLLINTSLAKVADGGMQLPERPFAFPQDVAAQLERAAAGHERAFGAQPAGLWPGGGAVAHQLIKPVSEAGFEWMASSDGVLAKTLGLESFSRDAQGVVSAADDRYRPYQVETGDGLRQAMVFGDQRLGDLIGADYAGMDPEAAAQDLIDRLLRIRGALDASGAGGPHLVSIIVDSEAAWAKFADGGAAFRGALFRKLGDAAARGEIVTTTPRAFLAEFPEQRVLKTLWPGATPAPDFSHWIGEPEENAAWGYLLRTRRFLEDYLTGRKPAEQAALDRAYDAMLLAEGGDWLWWLGADQDSGDDGQFDRAFRDALGGVYDALGAPRPDFLSIPVVAPALIAPDQPLQGVITPTVDGQVEQGEWDLAGAARGGAGSAVAALYLAVDPNDIVFRLDGAQPWSDALAAGQAVRVGVYFHLPGAPASAALSRLGPEDARRSPLGMTASHVLEWTLQSGGIGEVALYAASGDGSWVAVPATARARPASAATGAVLELSVPLALLGDQATRQPGDVIDAAVIDTQGGRVLGRLPADGALQVRMP
jgi:hypothetical protein